MSSISYIALTGIQYPPNKSVKAGTTVSDLPKEAIAWLLQCGAIEKATSTQVEPQPTKNQAKKEVGETNEL